ncbi:hypothetical protein HY639_05935 [Candidatus Woesearchaeota archaeon]|nr:hypothetical protein [Candidatus Woesearchaeota archaeon]
MTLTAKVAELYTDISGLVYFPEFLMKVSDVLINRSFRRTTAFATLFFGAAFFGDVSNKEWITYKQAAGYTIAVLAGSLGLGYLSKFLAGYKVMGNLQTAEANAFELLEEKKKSRAIAHLDELWERVYSYDAEMKYTEKEQLEEKVLIKEKWPLLQAQTSCLTGILLPDDASTTEVIRNLGRTKDGFVISMLYGLQQNIPLVEKKELIGFEIGKLVGWYNSSYFDTRNNAISDHYRASRTILKIKRSIGWKNKHQEIVASYIRDFWLRRIAHTLAIRVGAGITTLEAQHGRQYLNAQHFLWPTKKTDELLVQEFGVEKLKQLDEYRRSMLLQMFHSERIAERILSRAYGPNVELTTLLRADYDHEYILQELRQTPQGDYARAGLAFPAKIKQRQEQAAADKRVLDEFITEYWPAAQQDKEAYRAVRIAYHVNIDGVGRSIKRRRWKRDHHQILSALANVAQEKKQYTERIINLRKHHTLALIELLDCGQEINGLMTYRSPLYEETNAPVSLPRCPVSLKSS